jgi:hypothetical protein
VKEKKFEEGALRNKISQLFDYRKIDDLLRLGQLDQNKRFIDQLYQIQIQIYRLDAYLESQWELTQDELNHYWQAIQSALDALGNAAKSNDRQLRDIRRYERIERRCRKDEWPTGVSFKKFYSTKSCDVQLIRHLIYKAAPSLKNIWKENSWTYYDLITEINDDISDVEEDLQTYNGNRFLISILRKGTLQTEKAYRNFIIKSSRKADQYFKKHPSQEQHHELHEWTILRSQETINLLEKTMQQVDLEHLANALILPYMK